MRKSGLRPGDRLFLTKPLGTGIIATAHKREGVREEDLRVAVASMRSLNRAAMEAGHAAGVHAATDITGYGLLGHLLEMCRGSGVKAAIYSNALPLLPGVRGYIEAGFVPGGTRNNLADTAPHVELAPGIDETTRLLCADAQTSGGLLLALPAAAAPRLQEELAARGVLAAEIGEVSAGDPAGPIFIQIR